MDAAAPHRIVLVEDHPLFLEGIRQCLEGEPDFTVVGAWRDGTVDPDALLAPRPDLVLMDVQLPGLNGIELTARLHTAAPAVRLVMLTAHADGELLLAAMQAGAVGYLLKHTPPAELVQRLRDVLAGDHALTPELAARVLREFQTQRPRARPVPLPTLSSREEEVLKLLATGDSNRQIAQRLFVCEETIKSHVSAIFRKLEVSDRTRAAILAFKAGLVDA